MTGAQIVKALDSLYPKIETPLSHENQFQLLVATILSAQCTDAQVNKVTPRLFERYPDAKSLASAKLSELQRIIRSTGFYKVKSRTLVEMAKAVQNEFQGRVPDTMASLSSLRGVGRKTANIVLSASFGKIEGIAVDTHVKRLSNRIGLTRNHDPNKIEQDLMKITPKDLWPRLSLLLILHGRQICFARNPNCSECPLTPRCLYFKEQKKIGN